MKKDDLVLHSLPETPGVYFFLGAKKEILYIGKATSLRSRVGSYFVGALKEKRSALIESMVAEAVVVEFTATDSVLEALILETNLIRTHKPLYNTRSKDDKSYNHLIITNETWPRVLVVRGKDLVSEFNSDHIDYEFGPFTSAQLFKEALKIVQKVFRFYDTPIPVGQEKSRLARGKIDFNRQIGLYPENQSRADYLKIIRHIRLFFEGKKRQIIAELEKEMKQLARAEKFEAAGITKKRIFALQHIQDVALLKNETRVYRDEKNMRIEAYDISHLQSSDMVGAMTVLEGDEPARAEYRKFKIKTVTKANDPAALKEVLRRRLNHPEWPYPQLIVVDGAVAQKNVAQKVLQEKGLLIPVVAVVKDSHHKPIRLLGDKRLIDQHKQSILLANAESHRYVISYHRAKRSKRIKK